MPNQYLVDYLKQNKDKFSFEVLNSKLLESGYPSNLINEAAGIVYGAERMSYSVAQSKGFRDSKNKMVIAFIAAFGILVTVWLLFPVFVFFVATIIVSIIILIVIAYWSFSKYSLRHVTIGRIGRFVMIVVLVVLAVLALLLEILPSIMGNSFT